MWRRWCDYPALAYNKIQGRLKATIQIHDVSKDLHLTNGVLEAVGMIQACR